MRKLKILAALGVLALGLSGCSAPSNNGGSASANGNKSADSTSNQANPKEFDFSTIKADPEVEALVPEDVKARGMLRNGASTSYPPFEMLKEDGTTPTGAEVDMVKAIALTMGLKDGTTTTEKFDGLIAKVGSVYDIGASGFDVQAERVKSFDMLGYKDMGSLFAVAKGNPASFKPTDVCGTTIGVQTGTTQETKVLPELNKQCLLAGKPEIDVRREDVLDAVIPKVIGGQYDAVIADDPVIVYNVTNSNGQLEKAGEMFDAVELAVVVNNKNPKLSKAVQAAMNSLIKSGKMKEILAIYGAEEGLYPEVHLNTSVKQK